MKQWFANFILNRFGKKWAEPVPEAEPEPEQRKDEVIKMYPVIDLIEKGTIGDVVPLNPEIGLTLHPSFDNYSTEPKLEPKIRENVMAFDGAIIGRFRDLTGSFRDRLSVRVRREARLRMVEGLSAGLDEDAAKLYVAASIPDVLGDGERDWETFFTSFAKFLTALLPLILALMDAMNKAKT